MNRKISNIVGTTIVLVLSAVFANAQTVTGSGTSGTIPRWTGTSTLGNSSIKADSSGFVAIGATPSVNAKLYVLNTLGIGVKGEHTNSGLGVYGLTVSGTGIKGEATGGGRGVWGIATSDIGVQGQSSSGWGVYGVSGSSDGVYALTSSTDPTIAAVHGFAFTGGFAGIFHGNVSVTGTISKGGGSFKIDHPLDPENKYLYHSFVESPDMKNIYDGNIVTDDNGEAVVQMPDYFEALNSDYRYQLTVIGTFAQAIVAEKIKGNRFVIKTSAPSVEVSWQVTGIRQDAFANKYRIPVEELKPQSERGFYLHPEAFDKPVERSVEWAHNPGFQKKLIQLRLDQNK